MVTNVESKAAAGLKWGTLAKIIGQALSWAVTLLVFRLLTPEDYGLMAMCVVIVSIFAGVAEFGLGSSLVQARSVSDHELARVAGALALLNLGCCIIVVLGAPLFAQLLGDARIELPIRVLALQFILNAIEAVPQSLAYRDMRFKRLAAIELAGTLVGCAATLTLAWFGDGVWALVIGNLAGAAMRTVLYITLGTFIWPSFRLHGIASHMRFGGAVTATRFLWQTTYQADVLIAGRLLASEAVGLYSVAMHFATLPMQKAMGIVNQVAFPAVARLQDDLPRMRERLLDSLRLLAFVAIPTLWGISVVAPEFVDVVLGEKWAPAVLPLQIVSLVAPLRMLMAVLATALSGVGRADLELRNTIAGAIVLPIAFLIGADHGLAGLAVSWVVALPLLFALNYSRTLPPLGFKLGALAVAMRGPLAAGASMFAAVTAARQALLDYEEPVRLIVLIPLGAAVYLGTVWVLDRHIWRDVRRLATALRG